VIPPWFFLTLPLTFALSYLKTPLKELIVGLWKHHKEDVFFGFFKNSGMYFKISLAHGTYEITGKYKLVDKNLLRIEIDCQYGTVSGKPIFITPQVLKVTIQKDKIIFHDLIITDSEGQEFIRIKQPFPKGVSEINFCDRNSGEG
jgi:hypothetical protein